MADWLSSMQRTFEFYTVDPGTWKDVKLLDSVKSCTISRDSGTSTLGSATLDVTEPLGECYVRVYMITIQNGIREKHPLGTFLVQSPSVSFNGRLQSVSLDAYTPLIELNENQTPLGYYVAKGTNVMDAAFQRVRENVRAPVVAAKDSTSLFNDFVANTNDTWLTFIRDLISNAKHTLTLDELGRILFAPVQDTAALQPVWSYDDGNSSILYPDLSISGDLYGIPNVVEVYYSSENFNYSRREVNSDPTSPISTVNRGREIVRRVTNPELIGEPTENRIDEYAKQLLRSLSTLEYTVTYTHGYYPVRIGDCVRLNYAMAGLDGVKARVVSQTIKCDPSCPVTETAVFTKKLWG